MKDNDVWDLIELPEGVKPISCKWIFKTKNNSKGNVERYKARLVAKGFTQKEGIDYKETFSSIFSKDSFRTVMALVAHFDLELHQMDVKTVFLNGDIDKTIYMMQPENFVSNEYKSMVCKLKKSIYGLKQASQQWYHNEGKYIFLVLYINDILLASSDTDLLHETKRFLMKNFKMKDIGEVSFVLGIQILRDHSQGILRLSQENYINKVLEKFDMQHSKPGDTPIAKGDKFSLNSGESNVCSSLYSFVMGVFGRYLSDPRMQHWKAVKRVMRYLRRTKGHMLTYRKSEDLDIIGYFDSNFARCQDNKCSTSRYVYMLAGGAIS
ncbi:hypothetical protein CR513_35173, partial [Mucuna pruriens]